MRPLFSRFTFLLLLTVLYSADALWAADDLGDPKARGRELAEDLRSRRPTENSSISGLMHIKDAKGKTIEAAVKLDIVLADAGWKSIYDAKFTNGANHRLTIHHSSGGPNRYELVEPNGTMVTNVAGGASMGAFAGGDFWASDFGLEFFHWPDQKLVKKEYRRSQQCFVLESANAKAAAGSYGRVTSWIDMDTGGIVYAEAFDAQGKLLKEFKPTKLEKVDGAYQLKEMEIRNRQTGSRTTLTFDVEVK